MGGRLENNGEWMWYRHGQLKAGRGGCRPGERKLLGPSLGLDVIMLLKHRRQGRTGAPLGRCVKVKLWDRLERHQRGSPLGLGRELGMAPRVLQRGGR